VIVLLVVLFFAALITLTIGLLAGRRSDGRWKPLWILVAPSALVVTALLSLYGYYLWGLAHAP